MFRFTGVAAPGAFQRYEGTYGAVVRSFRPLTPQQRNSVSETRLHIATAHEGENIKTLSERTGNEWDLQTTAVFNDIFATEPLTAGTLVKIAVTRPYEPRRAAH